MKELPCIASIDEIELKDEPINGYEDFEIIISSEGEKTSVTPVDTAICEECVRIASLNTQIQWTEDFMHKQFPVHDAVRNTCFMGEIRK